MYFSPKLLQKNIPPTISMVHLLYRLYGVDTPAGVHVYGNGSA